MRPNGAQHAYPSVSVMNESNAMRVHDKRNDPAEPVSRAALVFSMILCVLVASTGCRLCCDREDAAFAAYGGIWERTERNSGRVGSLFDPGGARVGDVAPRDSVGGRAEDRSPIAPYGGQRESGSDTEPLPEGLDPQRKSDEETEQEFQERLRKFQEEKMLSAGIIPGEPAPPDFR